MKETNSPINHNIIFESQFPIFDTHFSQPLLFLCYIQNSHRYSNPPISKSSDHTRITLTRVHSSTMPHSNHRILYNYLNDASRVLYSIILVTIYNFSHISNSNLSLPPGSMQSNDYRLSILPMKAHSSITTHYTHRLAHNLPIRYHEHTKTIHNPRHTQFSPTFPKLY